MGAEKPVEQPYSLRRTDGPQVWQEFASMARLPRHFAAACLAVGSSLYMKVSHGIWRSGIRQDTIDLQTQLHIIVSSLPGPAAELSHLLHSH